MSKLLAKDLCVQFEAFKGSQTVKQQNITWILPLLVVTNFIHKGINTKPNWFVKARRHFARQKKQKTKLEFVLVVVNYLSLKL